VIGAGTVGLLTAAMARKSGCTDVTIIDVDPGRVNYAIIKGFATHGYVVPKPLPASPSSSSLSTSTYSGTSSPSGIPTPMSGYGPLTDRLEAAQSLAATILTITAPVEELSLDPNHDSDGDVGVDVTFECTGEEICMQTALYATRPGGKVIMVGMGTPIQTLPLSAAHLREVDILGIFRYANTYATGIRLLSAGCLPSLDDMVTHRFKGLDSAKQVFELAGRTEDDEGRLVLKVVIGA
jgi:L-iditol 2-dehydrogenase